MFIHLLPARAAAPTSFASYFWQRIGDTSRGVRARHQGPRVHTAPSILGADRTLYRSRLTESIKRALIDKIVAVNDSAGGAIIEFVLIHRSSEWCPRTALVNSRSSLGTGTGLRRPILHESAPLTRC